MKTPRTLLLAALGALFGCVGSGGAQGHRPAAIPGTEAPLLEFSVPGRAPVMALVMSGDGNWAHFISDLADTLVQRGVPVVGLESRRWLSHPRSPDELVADLEPALRHYLRAWRAEQIIVVGYSRGADFAPFLVNRLPADLRARIRGVALFSPTRMASFEFHLIDLVRYSPRSSDIPTIPEVDAMAPIPVLCVYGTDDEDTLCPELPPGLAEVVPADAGHRLNRPGAMADLVLERFARPRPPFG